MSKHLQHICHESVETSLNVYAHSSEQMKREAAKKIDEAKPGEPLPERVDVNLDSKYKIDVYAQLRANWDRFVDYVWRVSQNGE